MSEGGAGNLRPMETALADLRAKLSRLPGNSPRARVELEKMIRDLEAEIADRQKD